MKTLEMLSLALGLIASILGIIFRLFPEILSMLDVYIRASIVVSLFVVAVFPVLYDKKLRKRRITESYEFNPLHYYRDETNLIRGDLPDTNLFEKGEGITENEVEGRFATPVEFELPVEFQAQAESMWKKIESCYEKEGKTIGSNPTARLYSLAWNEKNEKLVLLFQKAQYWQAHVTNFNLDWTGWGEHIRNKIAPGPKLSPLSESKFSANHLGLNCILITEDGKIILQKRSMKVAVDPGSIGPSAGGRMKWEDRIARASPPSPFIGMFNQIHDELGITREEIDDLRLVAICRELQWGGKPTTIFIGRTNLPWKEVEQRFESKPESYWETDQLWPLNGDNRKDIEKMIERNDVGLPTKVCLYYYLKHARLQ